MWCSVSVVQCTTLHSHYTVGTMVLHPVLHVMYVYGLSPLKLVTFQLVNLQ